MRLMDAKPAPFCEPRPTAQHRAITSETQAHTSMRTVEDATGAGAPPATDIGGASPRSIRGRRTCHHARRAALAVGVVLPFVLVLDAVAKDTTPPVVKLEIKQAGHYHGVKTATMSSGSPLTVRAVARDPQGIKSLTISFPPVTSSSCTVNGAIYTGSFPITLPPSKSVHTNSLHTKLVKGVTISYPTCEVPGSPTQTGEPIGHKFTVILVAHNRSSNSSINNATTKLKVKMQ